MREWLARLADWFRRDRLERELDEEMRFHQQQIEDEIEAGNPAPGEAARLARRRIGNAALAVDQARDRWSLPWLDAAGWDLRDALRGVRRSPAFAATVVLTLSLGIGANVAMFDLVDRLMFRPLALLRDPGTVHRLYQQYWQRGQQTTDLWVSFQRYQDLQSGTTSFDGFAGFVDRVLLVGSGESARELRVAAVTASYFGFFDAAPVRGRFFGDAEDTAPLGADVVVLSESFWRSEFGGRDVVGDTIDVGSIRATVVGVAPRAFTGLNDAQPSVLFLPITTMGKAAAGPGGPVRSTGYGNFWAHAIVRRKAAVSVERASADLTEALRRSWERQRQAPGPPLPPVDEARPAAIAGALRPGAGPMPNLEARTSLWLAGVAALVLVIATVNVTSLLFARAQSRRHESSVRVALGVTRGRLLAGAVTESLVLAVIGAAGGLCVAWWGGGVLRGVLAPGGDASPVGLVAWRTLGLTAALTIACGVVAGLVLGWLGLRAAASTTPPGASGRRGVTRSALPAGFVVLQGALSVALLIGAALFVRSLLAVQAMPMGYDASRVLVVTRVLRGAPPSPEERLASRRLLLDAARALPQVESAAWMTSIPLGVNLGIRFTVPGIENVDQLGQFTAQESTPEYFDVMGTRVLRGRAFTGQDGPGAPRVAVVSEGAARVLWPGGEAIGQCVHVGPPPAPCTRVIGVVEDIVQTRITARQQLQVYFPVEQTSLFGGTGMVLRMRGDPAVEAEAVRRALQPHVTGLSYLRTQPLADLVGRAQRSWRLGATLFVAFGLLALAVAATGFHGLLAFNAAQRLPEFGLRVALGAGRRSLYWLILGPALRHALAGVALGAALALLAGRWIEPLLFEQSTADPGVYLVVGLTMVVVAIAASLPSAVRAARVDPNVALQAG